jgi:hypothetical protein
MPYSISQEVSPALFLRRMPLDEVSLADVGEVEIVVWFSGGPDLRGFKASVVRRRTLHVVRFPPILEIKLQIRAGPAGFP